MQNIDRPVVVLSTGRAGSTLLQKLLNTHSELAIFGEHQGFLNGLVSAWAGVEQSSWIPASEARGNWLLSPDRPLRPTHWSAWDGSFSRSQFSAAIRSLLDGLFASNLPDGVRWGFKEIRYRDPRLVGMLTHLYPGVQFVMLLRSPVDSCVSFASAELRDKDAGPVEIRQVVHRIADRQIRPFLPFYESTLTQYPERVITVFYEDLEVRPFDVIARIGTFLELASDFDTEAIAAIANEQLVSERARASPELLDSLHAVAREALADAQRLHHSAYATTGIGS